MKLNEHIALANNKVLLVPYESQHVSTYHEWMKDPSLQAATASDPLTLEEEYAMQRSWRTDRDKLTFIVCLPNTEFSNGDCINDDMRMNSRDEESRMVGDVNLFLFPLEDDDDDEEGDDREMARCLVGEIELMIASRDMQGKGLGRASLVTFMWYVLTRWKAIASQYGVGSSESTELCELAYLRAKINEGNERSLNLFKSVGFEQIGSANYFGEIELRWSQSLEYLRKIKGFESTREDLYNFVSEQSND